MRLNSCVGQQEVLYLVGFSDPAVELIKVCLAGAVVIDNSEHLSCKGLNSETVRLGKTDEFAEAYDGGHDELGDLLAVQGTATIYVKSAEEGDYLVFEGPVGENCHGYESLVDVDFSSFLKNVKYWPSIVQ